MPFTFEGKVRYSECDSEGRLTPFSVINYLQDCSTFQSEQLGVGLEQLKDKHRAWFLNSWHIYFDRYPRLGEHIEAGTFAYGFSGFYGYRHFFIRGEDGAYAVRADSAWFFFDTERQCPVKPEPEDTELYEEAGAEKLHDEMGMPKLQRKIALPGGMEALEPMTVTRHLLDSNKHVNNAWYVDIAAAAAGLERPRELRVEYRKAAVLGDIIIPRVSSMEDGYMVNLSNTDEKPYAVIELKR